MQMLTLRNIHWTIDLLWSWGLWCCWSTNHKSYCGGMWTWRTPQQCWLRGRQVHLGHRLGVLASLLVNIALKLHSEESKYTSASPRSTCFPPRATSTQVPLVQVQVHLGCASVNLALDSGDLSGVSGWAPRATSAQVPLVKSKFTSAAPRWTWPWLGELERSPPSSHPPTLGLILKLIFPSKKMERPLNFTLLYRLLFCLVLMENEMMQSGKGKILHSTPPGCLIALLLW